MADRITRLNELLLRELGALLHGKFRGDFTLITITRVEVTADLRDARVYFSAPNSEAITAGQLLLRRMRGELRHILSQRIRLHHFPDLHFHCDGGQIKALRVYEILDDLAVQKTEIH
ncbi:MAG: ribosome-binding factor A [Puniceicoccales bacterium]|jgi:ribosome-binding factor A|nr:ribosome-binding factor A [Puniceicoccales bacterium]